MLEPKSMSDKDELWRVRIAPGDEKVLTLEQIDDLYRLDVIDENTLLWQAGMSEWLPLKVVAGLDSDESAAAPAPLPTAPAQLPVVTTQPAATSQLPRPPTPPPPLRAAPLQSELPPAVAPIRRNTLMVGWTAGPAFDPPPPTPSAAPSQFSVAPAGLPLVAVAYVPPAPPAPAPQAAAPLAPARASRAEFALLGLAALLGLLLTLHRNGALFTLSSAGAESLEASLGGPGFGTPREVEVLVKKASTPAAQASAPR
jgi:uncharacterized protein DUF4339